jgi:hypothetical protein
MAKLVGMDLGPSTGRSAFDSSRDRRVWSRLMALLTEFPAVPEGLTIPDVPEALVGDGPIKCP